MPKNNWGNYTNSRIEAHESATAFYSYATPIVIVTGGKVYQVNTKFSRTTSKQVNRFKREHGLNDTLINWLDRSEFYKLAIAHNFSTGLL